MKIKDIQIGGEYVCRVSGKLVTVKVTALGLDRKGRRNKFDVTNLSTGRRLVVGLARLRYPAVRPHEVPAGN